MRWTSAEALTSDGDLDTASHRSHLASFGAVLLSASVVLVLGAILGAATTPMRLEIASETVRFGVAGDVGTGGSNEWSTADAMNRAEDASASGGEYQALLLLGDNIYPDGDASYIEERVLEPFSGVLDGPTRLIAALGNHDVRNENGSDQQQAIGMPGRWYATRFNEVLVVTLDSNSPGDPEQRRWLEQTLANKTTRWAIVMLHHPPYSAGHHGSDIEVRDAFTPLFERYEVDLVLAGHDHNYERSEPINGVTYVVSGAAALLRPVDKESFTAVSTSTYHFVDITVVGGDLTLRAIGQDGVVFDHLFLTDE